MPSNTYEELGKLMFQTGLPQVLGLYPEDDVHQQPDAQEAAIVLIGMLKSLADSDHFDAYDLPQWQQVGLSQFKLYP